MFLSLNPSAGPPPDGVDVIVENAMSCFERVGRVLTLWCQNLGPVGINAATHGATVWLRHDGTWHMANVPSRFCKGGELHFDCVYPLSWKHPSNVVVRAKYGTEQVELVASHTCEPSGPEVVTTSLTL